MTPRARLIILSGPSGAGKTTLHEKLLHDPEFKERVVRSVSMTTRAPRGREKNGIDYFFVSKTMFEFKIRQKHLLEWAKVFDNYYGTPVRMVRAALKSGKSILLCIDVQGAQQVKARVSDAVMIFVRTPSLEDLRQRLKQRDSDTSEAMALRLKTAEKELEQARHYDYVIVNDVLDKALDELRQIVRQEIGMAPVRASR
jgi:guanylate kinase